MFERTVLPVLKDEFGDSLEVTFVGFPVMKGIWNADIQNLELYDLAHDPGELEDVSADYPDLARTLERAASDWVSDCSAVLREPEQIEDFDEEVRQQLRSLGYFN